MPLTEFTFQQLVKYSNNFNEEIGRGSFGYVFKGSAKASHGPMTARMDIAIKASHNTRKSEEARQWQREIDHLSRHEHPNIIKLYGHAEDAGRKYLVYEFMNLGSLNNNLEDLDWAQTKKVAQGSAAALEYLHNQEPALVFRDFKASNILIDQEYNAKLSDFGVVKEEGGICHDGTWGCTDPSAMKKGLNVKSTDLYGMGVLIMQLITKEDVLRDNSIHITSKVQIDRENENDFLNLRLRDSGCNYEDARELIDLAFKCTHADQTARPTMEEVSQLLRTLT